MLIAVWCHLDPTPLPVRFALLGRGGQGITRAQWHDGFWLGPWSPSDGIAEAEAPDLQPRSDDETELWISVEGFTPALALRLS